MANILDAIKDSNVKLIGTMPRESYIDMAAAITRTEKDLDGVIAMPYNKDLVKKIADMGHLATAEFDYFIFAVEGLSRVTEAQLVRKRLASYIIKSGRVDKNGRRSFDVVRPQSLKEFYAPVKLDPSKILLNDSTNLADVVGRDALLEIDLTYEGLAEVIEQWYNYGVDNGYPEEDLRYMKPQGTEFKALIAMNAHSLIDWFKIRCCNNAQHEIRDGLAKKMLKLCKEHSPVLFESAGPACVFLGYCPENDMQHKNCKGKVMTHKEVKEMIKTSKTKE